MHHRSSRLRVALFLILVATSTGALAATPEQTAAARAAAQAGVAAYESGEYDKALELFTSAEGLVHALTHVLFQARCHEKLGHLVQARELYIALTRENLPANAPAAFAEAQGSARTELQSVEAKIPYVTLVVTGEGARDATITLDDSPIPRGLAGVPYPVNPGQHRFAADGGNRRKAVVEVTLSAGEKRRIELTLVDAATPTPLVATQAPAPVATPVATPTGEVPMTKDQPRSGSSWMTPVGWTALGVGVAGVAAGTYFYLDGRSKLSDSDSIYSDCNVEGTGCSDEQRSKIDQLGDKAVKRGWYAGAGFAVGLVGVGAGVTLLLLAPSHSKQSAFIPYVTPTSAGVAGCF